MSFNKHGENENEMNWDVTIICWKKLFLYLFPIKLFGRDINDFFFQFSDVASWASISRGV